MHPKGGLTHEDAKQVARRLDDTGQIDFFDISLGTFHNLFLVEGSMHTPLAYTVALSAGIRSVVDLPVYATNRINDPHLAESLLEQRPRGHGQHGAGPDRGPGAAQQGAAKAGRRISATASPATRGASAAWAWGTPSAACRTRRPETRRHWAPAPLYPASRPKRVVVVGAGPAGLEAARVAALRKHRVMVFEKNQRSGGQNLLAARGGRPAGDPGGHPLADFSQIEKPGHRLAPGHRGHRGNGAGRKAGRGGGGHRIGRPRKNPFPASTAPPG